MTDSSYDSYPAKPRWTHIALRVNDIEATIAWYEEFTPMELLARNQDDAGWGAWLGMSDSGENPFVLVVAQFITEKDPFQPAPNAVLAPFAHLGIEMTERSQVDDVAAKADAAGCLAMPARQMPDPIGYICMIHDPDGNTIEFSHDQGVYAKAHEVWGTSKH